MKTRIGHVVAAAAAVWALSAPAHATTTWDFYQLTQPGGERSLGSSYTFLQSGQSIVASIFPMGTTSETLFAKNDGTGERGIGVTPGTENEIFHPYGIELTATGGAIMALQIGSVQKTESWQVEGSNDGLTWTDISHGVGGGTGPASNEIDVTGLAGWKYLLVDVPYADGTNGTGGHNNIVLDSAVTTSVPEPATLVLLALGLAGVGFTRKRKTS